MIVFKYSWIIQKKENKISIEDFIDKIIDRFTEIIKRTALTQAANYLFQIRDKNKATKLDEERAITFCHAVAQLLFISV